MVKAPLTAMKKIMIVDQDTSQGSMTKALKDAGYEVALATGAPGGLPAPGRDMDLVLLNLDSLKHEGWEICRSLAGGNGRIPIIILTGKTGQFKEALATGATALMEKPIAADRLVQVVQALLSKSNDSDPYPSRGTFYYIAATHQPPHTEG